MKTIEKVFITIGLLIILLISGSVYLNNRIDQALNKASGLGVFLVKPQSAQEGLAASKDQGEPNYNHGNQTITPSEEDSSVSSQPSSSSSDLVFDDDIEAIIQTRLDRPIERKDKIKVALILIKRLSVDDITYFYDLISLGDYSRDDVLRARGILSANLNEEEMDTLRDMAHKYSFTP